MRRALWLFPCWVACTSATPPPDAAGPTKEAAPAPEVAAAASPICELGTTRPCYPGPEGTAGVGACKAGVETCETAGFGACTGAVAPAAEEDCRTPHDEDCDGRSDDCPEVAVAFATAFTSDRELELAAWGGGLGVVRGALFWVVEPGGRVLDVLETDAAEPGSSWEFDEEREEAETVVVGGAWPGALLRSYQTGGTRAGSIMEQERWNGAMLADVENADEYLQWRYEQPLPWHDGHAIALEEHYSSYEMMEALDPSTREHGGIEAAEQRKLQRKLDRLLEKAKRRLVIVAAEEVEPWEPSFELFSVEGDEGEDEDGEEGEGAEPEVAKPEVDATKPDTPKAEEAPTAVAEPMTPEPATEETTKPSPKLPQPPALPTHVLSFTPLSDGTVVILTLEGLQSWKPKQRRWTVIEPPSPSFKTTTSTLHAGLDGELLVLDCSKAAPTTVLWRHHGAAWSNVPLPTPACPDALAVAPDRTRWVVVGDQLWQRRPGEDEPWKRVPLPGPWKPREVVVFDGLVWVAAAGEGEQWAVLVDRPVPMARVLPPK